MRRLLSRLASRGISGECTNGAKLRALLESPNLQFLMEAHSGLSARIVEEAGFQGIWASGLSISAQLGVRDSNEVSWTQVVDVVEYMCDSTSIPVLLDGDTGFGNFNNARRLTKKLQQIDCGGVCIEDKLFPKTNSFLSSGQKLADVNEFCGKIAACKESQVDPDFVVVARLESFIAGLDAEDALFRADAYVDAGADAILVHSKKSDPSDIEAFVSEWDNRAPLIIVPTKYYQVPTEVFEQMGISMVIWANHNMRSAMKAMQVTSQSIFEDQSLVFAEEEMCVPLSEVFRITDQEELTQSESRYLHFEAKDLNGSASSAPPATGSDLPDLAERSVGAPPKQVASYSGSSTEERHYQIEPTGFLKLLNSYGTDFFTGVPDSLLRSFCNCVVESPDGTHVIAANEGGAVGLAAGHYLSTGRIPLVYMQNSGVGNAVNPLVSLTSREAYSIPMLLLVGWRGEPFNRDEPQHRLQGRITRELLDLMQIPNTVLSEDFKEVREQVSEAYMYMQENQTPYAIVVRKNSFADFPKAESDANADLPFRMEYLDGLFRHLDFDNDLVVSSTGFVSRELMQMNKMNSQSVRSFYMAGSMGHAGQIASGIALSRSHPSGKVICLDGDGAALMHLGALSTTASLELENYVHIVMRNAAHESVGAQPLGCGEDTCFHDFALAAGFDQSVEVFSPQELEDILEDARSLRGAVFIEAWCRLGTMEDLIRPTKSLKDLRNDFMLGISLQRLRNG